MTTYYIDNSAANASDKNSGTSAGSPFADLAALSKISLQPGDTVALKAGTVYNVDAAGSAALTLTASGTADKPITITSYGTGDKPIINNTSTVMYSDAIDLKNAHYVTIDGIGFHNATQAAVNVASTSSYITVQNSEMTNVGEGVLLNGTHNLVTENYIHDLHMVKDTPTNTTSAATIAATNNDDYGANGVVIGNSYNEVSFNKIVDAKAQSYDYGTDGGGIELFGTMTNVSIHDNYVAGSQGFLEAGGSAGAVLSNITISNNVALNNGNFIDIHNGGGSFAATFSNVQVTNNTVVDQTNASKEMATIFFDAPGVTAAQVNVANNIISLNDGDSVFKQQGAYHSNNLIYLQAGDTHLYNNWVMTLGTGEKYGNPGLSNAASGNFTPTASGLAQSVGAVISAKLQAVISGAAITSTTAVSSVTFAAVSHYSASGALSDTSVTNADGSSALTTYATGQNYAMQQAFYNAAGTLVELDQYAASGVLLFKQSPGAAGTTTDNYSTAGVLLNENVLHADGTRDYTNHAVTGQGYTTEHIAYNAAGAMVEDDQYATNGVLLAKKVVVSGTTATDQYSATGTLLNEKIISADGSCDYTNHAVTGQSYTSEHTVYNAAGKLVEDDQYAANGTLLGKVVVAAGTTTTDHYSAAGVLLNENVLHADGTRDYTNNAVTGQSYTSEHTAYAANGALVEDDRYTSAGTLIFKQVVAASGTTTDTYSSAGAHLTSTALHADGSKDVWNFAGANGSSEHDSYNAAGLRTVVDITNANGSHTTTASAGGLTLAGNAGVSDTFQSFGNDTFTFGPNGGADTIKGFHAGNAAGHDTIQISVAGIDTFAQLQALMTASADHASTIIHLSAADTITVDHVAPAALTAADFQITHPAAAHA